MIFIHDSLREVLAGRDPFDFLEALPGRIYRQLEGRVTKRVEIGGEGYFVKLHHGVGWREIFKNLLQLRAPVISAANEWHALNQLRQLGLDTMEVVAYGREGTNPARVRSFLVTRELTDTVSLEDYCRDWPQRPPTPALKRRLIERVAVISRSMHGNGICHRDFYLCHFLLHTNTIDVNAPANLKLSLIDLHRARISSRLGRRWIEKDLAGLYFSSLDIGLGRRDYLRFIRHYTDYGLRRSLRSQGDSWRRVVARAEALYRKHHGKPPIPLE